MAQVITVSKEMAEKCKKWLDIDNLKNLTDEQREELEVKEDDVALSETTTFSDGTQAELKVCSGQTNYWAEVVWFNKDGEEIECSQPSFDGIDGLWECNRDSKYNVEVVIGD